MKAKPITETIPLWQLSAYLKRHKLVIVRRAPDWRGNKLHIQTRREIDEPKTPEEIDAVLRAAGYDPDEVGARMKATAERAIAKTQQRMNDDVEAID